MKILLKLCSRIWNQADEETDSEAEDMEQAHDESEAGVREDMEQATELDTQ